MKKGLLLVIIIVFAIIFFINNGKTDIDNKKNIMIDLSMYSKEDIKEYAKKNNLKLNILYEERNEEDKFISQSIKPNKEYEVNDKLTIVFSKKNLEDEYRKYNVNELGNVPIMMYHNIYNKNNSDTNYTGGNVDKDGYNRTKEAFINDLNMYYNNGYRMMRLIDYINGDINVELGKSPIILTFDDGNENNIKVVKEDEKGNIIIDPNSAVGILEDFKKKYKDFNVTATFFLNEGLFQQPKYNEKIIKWLISNGYDIGNHTLGHVDFTKINSNESEKAVGYLYKKLNDIIGDSYVSIVALPYGSPYSSTHPNFQYIIEGSYDNFNYNTSGILRVGWDANESPFNKNFNPLFMKRVRAYDNLGKEFDIEMVFKNLQNTRYISDGDSNTVVITNDKSLKDNINKRIIKY